MPRIFISYRREKPDNEVALALYRRLSDAGHDVFLDSERIHVGERWPRTIRAALDYTEWFVALVSLQYLYSVHCKDELETAAKRHLRDDLPRIVPVPLAYNGQYDEVTPAARQLLHDTQAFHWYSAADTPAMLDALTKQIPPAAILVKGMRAFEQSDAEAFRELRRGPDVDRCLSLLCAHAGLTLIHGVSGAGKTSFVRAGLLPKLKGSWSLFTSTNAAEGDPLGEAGAAKTLIVDQFEQAIVRLSRDPAGPGAFEQAVIAWLAADADRRAVLVIRDEYRTAFDTVLPELSERARSFALLPLRVADAAHALTTILDSARIEHDPGFVGRLVDELADGVPPRVRPAMLQLVAHEAWASRRRFDKNLWEQTPTSRRAFFERHVRSTVLGQLAASISRYDAARALRGLCVAELKAAPRTAEEVATAEQLSPAIARQVLDLAAAPHARVALVEIDGSVERFQLTHDLFAGAVQSLVKEAKDQHDRRFRTWAQRIGGGLATVVIVLGIAAAVLWRRADDQRLAAERENRRQVAARLASHTERHRANDPSAALALAVEALRATAPQSPTAEAENALRDALSSTSGRALAGHSSPIDRIAVSRDGRQLATSDTSGTIRIWKVEDLTAPAHVLVQPYSSSSMSRSLAPDVLPVLAFTPDGNLIAGADLLWRWDLRSLRAEPMTPQPSLLNAPMLSSDRGVLVACSWQPARIWIWNMASPDVRAGRPSRPLKDYNYCAPEKLSPDNHWLLINVFAPGASANARQVYIILDIKADNSTPIVIAESDLLTAVVDGSPEGRHLQVLALTDDRRIVVLVKETGAARMIEVADNGALRAGPVKLEGKLIAPAAWDIAHPGSLFVGLEQDRICRLDLQQDDIRPTCRTMPGGLRVVRGGWVVTTQAVRRESLWHPAGDAETAMADSAVGLLHGAPVDVADLDDAGTVLGAATGALGRVWFIAENEPVVDGRFQVASYNRNAASVRAIEADMVQRTATSARGTNRPPAYAPSTSSDAIADSAIDHERGIRASLVRDREIIVQRLGGGEIRRLVAPAGVQLNGFMHGTQRWVGLQHGRWVLATDDAKNVYLWDLTAATDSPVRSASCGSTLSEITVSPDARWIVLTGAGNGKERAETCAASLVDPRTDVRWDAQRWPTFSNDGSWVVFKAYDGSSQLWRMADHPQWQAWLGNDVEKAYFSLAGNHLVIGGHNGAALWTRRAQQWWRYPLAASATSHFRTAAFSADARWLAIAADQIAVWKLDDQNGGEPWRVFWEERPIDQLRFRPDSRQLAAGGTFGSGVVAWNLAQPEAAIRLAEIRETSFESFRYSEDGQHVVVTDASRGQGRLDVALWFSGEVALTARAQQLGGRNLTSNEWRDAFGAAPYRKTFPGLPEHESRIIEFVRRGQRLVKSGDIASASASYHQAALSAIERVDPELLRSVCACGVESGLAASVLSACDRLVALAPQAPMAVSAYATAMLAIGDRSAAARSLRTLIEVWHTSGSDLWAGAPGNTFADRDKWLDQLEHGQTPTVKLGASDCAYRVTNPPAVRSN